MSDPRPPYEAPDVEELEADGETIVTSSGANGTPPPN
jgi:hypothetical protein